MYTYICIYIYIYREREIDRCTYTLEGRAAAARGARAQRRRRDGERRMALLSCAIYTHTPARKSSTNFQLYYFVIQICSTNWLGHGHGYKWHSSPLNNNNI